MKSLRTEASQLKEMLAEVMMGNRLLKKSVLGDGEDDTWGIRPRRSWRGTDKLTEVL